MRNAPPEPLILTGSQRSGTSFLAKIVGKHPAAFVTIDGKLLYYLVVWLLRGADAEAPHPRVDEVAHALRRKRIHGITPEQNETFVRAVEAGLSPEEARLPPVEIARRLWDRAYASVAGGQSVIGDKYNEYLLQLDEIAAILPGARYVFIHRHPAACAASMLERFAGRPWRPPDLVASFAKWAVWNERWIRFRGSLTPGRALEVDYEALAVDFRGELARIFEFLGLERDEAVIDAAASDFRPTTQAKYGGVLQDYRSALTPHVREVAGQLGRSIDRD